MFVVTRQVLVAGCGAGAVALSLDFKSMYRSHHRKIRVENRGRRYELFLSADNAQHILERADDPSHGFDLVDAEKMCYAAYYVSRGPGKKSNEAHDVVYGFVLFASPTEASQPKYYQLVGYTTELYGGRFILETCHLPPAGRCLPAAVVRQPQRIIQRLHAQPFFTSSWSETQKVTKPRSTTPCWSRCSA